MGIEQRDYYRNDSGKGHGPPGLADIPTVTKRLLIATILVFLAQIFVSRPANRDDFENGITLNESLPVEAFQDDFDAYSGEEFQLWLPQVSPVQQALQLDPQRVKQGQVWRMVTYAFCHERYGMWHFVVNLLLLYWLGSRLERMYGSQEFCLFFFAATIAAGLAFLVLGLYTGSHAATIGASGAVWGLIALYVIHHPYERVNLFGLFPVEIRWIALLYLVYDLHPVLLAVNGDRFLHHGGVAHATHLGGAAFGWLYFKGAWRISPLWDKVTGKAKHSKWTKRTVSRAPRDVIPLRDQDRPTVARIDPAHRRLEAQLDQVLEKIQSEGRDALTEDEVRILEEASKQFRDR